MESWVNGAKGSEVKRVVDNNFDILDKRKSPPQSGIGLGRLTIRDPSAERHSGGFVIEV